MPEQKIHISGLKKYMMEKLKDRIPGIDFNGDISDEGSNYKVLNVSLHQMKNLIWRFLIWILPV